MTEQAERDAAAERAPLWLVTAHVRALFMDAPEQDQALLVAAPDEVTAIATVRLYPDMQTADLAAIELVENVARVWGRRGEPWMGTAKQPQ